MKIFTLVLLMIASFTFGYYFFQPAPCSAQGCDLQTSLITVSPEEFNSKLNMTTDPVLIDIRTLEEFNQGHIANAINSDFYQTQDFNNKLDSLDKSSAYFIYCRSGNRSGQALELMRQKGFTNVTNLAGGIAAWESNLPTTK